jgi:TonB-linked SusC/RagA family outer membrane protein
MVFSVGVTIAQEKTITGKVSAEGEGTLPGVNVTVQGSTIGTITDANGAYSIRVPGPTSVLVFSSIGYVTQGIPVGAQTTIDVVLISDVKALQEVVVTGYTAQRKREITGAVGVVETEKLVAIPVGNVANQLQGRTSGVTVVGDGQPGSTSKVRIRGFGSFQANEPLYIVDGVPTTDISSINPNDVASMTVLKDAGAASVYGSRASNGVIVVTTKRGATGIKVTYDLFAGTTFPGKGPEGLLTTQEFADLQWLVYDNDGITETHPIYGPSSNASPTLPSWAANTNWWDEYTEPAMTMNHDLTMSGGSDKAKFFAAIGYLKQDGIVIYNYADKYTGRFNSDYSFLNDRLKLGENLTFAYRQSNGVANLGEGSPFQMGSYRAQPIVPVKWTGPDYVGLSHTFKAGDWGGTGIAPRLGNNSNTVANQTRGKDNHYHNIRAVGNAYLDVKILEGVNFRSTIGGTFFTDYYKGYTFATYENSENTATASLGEGTSNWFDWIWTNTINVNKTFGQHKVNGVVGYEAVESGIGGGLNASRAGYFSDAVDFRTLTNGAQITGASSYIGTPRRLISQFAKADYSFQDKYLVSATIRRDGSSVFGKDTRYGIFPSFSAGWRIKQESFLQGVAWINDLKLRGSYGTMGNQSPVSPDNQYYLYGGDVSSSNYDITGAGTGSMQGFRPTRIGNVNAKWETNVTTNVGFEGTFLNDKIAVVFDWYSKQTKDLLFNLELPGIYGAASTPYTNVAQMSNKGIDVELTYKNTWGDFGVNVTGTLTTYKNEITKIAEGVLYFDDGGSRIGPFNRNMVGHPISAFYGYQVVGIFQTPAEVTAAPQQDGAEPGFLRFQNNDTLTKVVGGVRKQYIGDGDRTFIGDPNPAFTYGLNLTLTWKSFDLTAFLYGSQGNDIFNWNKWWIDFWPSFQGQKSTDLLYNSWTLTNTGATVPKASNKSNFSTNTVSCSYYIEDGSYARLKNLQLGYKLPQAMLNKLNIKSLRVYIQGLNLLTLTKYSGLDPELSGGDTAFGVDSGNYPQTRQIIFGLNLVL